MTEEPKIVGKYELVERVARRSSGRVYKAKDSESGREVIVRTLPLELATDEESLKNFEHEVEAATKVRHVNVARVLDHGLEDGRLYYVTEAVEGMTLRRLMKRRKLSLQEIFLTLKQITRGIAAIHAQDIVHGDLNPDNILVSDDLRSVKLASFGVSRSTASGGKTLTGTASTTGGFHYLSPEAAVDGDDLDHRADIYSLGAVFYHMLTGKAPSGNVSLPSRVDSNVPDAVDPIVLKCLEANPANRYSTARLLLGEVEKVEDRLGLGLVSELQGISRSFSGPAQGLLRHRGLLIGAGVIVVVGALGLLMWGVGRTKPDPAATAVVSTPVPADVEQELTPEEVAPGPSGSAEGEEGDGSEGAEDVAEAVDEPVEASPPAESRRSRGPDLSMALEIATEKARNGLIDQALADLAPLVGANVPPAIASEALFLRGRLEEAQSQYEQALATYTEIQTRFADKDIQAQAAYRFGRAAIDSGDASRLPTAMRVFQELAGLYPRSEYAPRAMIAVMTMQSASRTQVEDSVTGKRVPTAFVTARDLVGLYPDADVAEYAWYQVGETYDDIKLFPQAADAFEALTTRFPNTETDAWWRLGQIYDRRLDDKARAIAAYRRVPEGSDRYNDAQKRINRLSR